MEKEPWRRYHGEGTVEEIHGGEIMKEKSWRSEHGEEIIEKKSWRRNDGGEITEEK